MVLTTWDVTKWFALAVMVAFLWYAREVLTPFVVGAVLAYILSPLADQLVERTKMSRSWCIAIRRLQTSRMRTTLRRSVVSVGRWDEKLIRERLAWWLGTSTSLSRTTQRSKP